MKKIVYLIAVLLLALTACKKEPEKAPVEKPETVSVTGITLTPTSIQLTPGGSQTLTATLTPADASNQGVIWSTDNPAVATVSGGTVQAVSVGSATITATTDDGGFTATCSVTVGAIPVTAVSLSQTSLMLDVGETFILTATLTPSGATDKSIIWVAMPKEVVTVADEGNSFSCEFKAVGEGNAVITAYALGGNGAVKAECNVSVKKVIPAGAVDLGLGVYWAECNLGASSPEGYGDYYAWGEVKPKDYFTWATYKWSNGPLNRPTKYCPTNMASLWDGEGNPDGKEVLDLEDDAAHVQLGGNWRMPTLEEWLKLAKCEYTWTTQNGVTGMLVTGNNGNSIFLPAAGYKKTTAGGVGTNGYYWTSTLRDDMPEKAWYGWVKEGTFSRASPERYVGYPVRPVYPATE